MEFENKTLRRKEDEHEQIQPEKQALTEKHESEKEEEELVPQATSIQRGVQRMASNGSNTSNQPVALTKSNARKMAMNKAGASNQPLAMTNPAVQVQQRLQGKGQSLSGETKGKVENALGADLNGVKIHTGSEGNEVAQEHNARALTVGKDIAFANGEYKPGTMEGDALLLHEAHHTLQQKDAAEHPEKQLKEENPQTNEHAYEKEADEAALIGTNKIWGKSESWIGKMAGKTKNAMKTGLSLQTCSGNADPKKLLDSAKKDTLKGADSVSVRKKTNPNAFKLTLTPRELNQYVATVMAESAQGDEQLNAIAWVYYNRMTEDNKKNVHKGLNASSAYSGRGAQGWYKAHLTALGETDYVNEKLPQYIYKYDADHFKGKTYGQYVKSEYYVNVTTPRLNKMKAFIEDTVLKEPEYNPFPGWMGQGYWGDLNRDDQPWKSARQYLWLQKENKVKIIYVKELRAGTKGKDTSFVFDSVNILKYFVEHPDQMPASVPLYDPATGLKVK